MKSTLLALLAFALFAFALLLGCGSRVDETPQTNADATPMTQSTFDSALAAKLGADEYGMRKYTMVFLKPGDPANTTSKSDSENKALQLAHLKHLFAQKDAGTMSFAGPMGGDAGIEGICIYNVGLEEAKAIAEADPRAKAGQLKVECYPFYGSAALMLVPELADKVSKKSVMEMFK